MLNPVTKSTKLNRQSRQVMSQGGSLPSTNKRDRSVSGSESTVTQPKQPKHSRKVDESQSQEENTSSNEESSTETNSVRSSKSTRTNSNNGGLYGDTSIPAIMPAMPKACWTQCHPVQ